jgi:hypothetical protein
VRRKGLLRSPCRTASHVMMNDMKTVHLTLETADPFVSSIL